MIRRYFDNAATTFPKPPGVVDAVRDYMERLGASAGRGAYAEAVEAGRMVADCRTAIRRLLNARDCDPVIFTLNGTDALNLGLKSLLRPGDHVVTTVMEHNSVLRPLHALAERGGVTWTAVEADPESTRVEPAAIEAAVRPDTALIALNHGSNVTGALQPLAEVSEIAARRGIPLLVDAAQSAGHVPIDLARTPVDLLAFPGHKGLMGPQGTGVLVVREAIAQRLATVREGGTGSASESPVQPALMPDKFEAGSHNGPGLAGLLAALRWLGERGVARLRAHELALCEQLDAAVRRLAGVRVFGPADAAARVGVFSIRVDGLEPQELSATLDGEFGILTRSGLHCAPWAHRAIGTHASGGTTRLSFGAFTTSEDVAAACAAIEAAARVAAT